MSCKLREIPPWTTVLEVLTMLNLPSAVPFTFQKSDLRLDDTGSIVGLLEPYYIPCKAREFLGHTSENRWITILRHILQPHGYKILCKETTRNRKKTILYTVDRAEGALPQAVKVDFS